MEIDLEERHYKDLELFAKSLPIKKAICTLKDCISCTEHECENKKLISEKIKGMYIALEKMYSPISCYIDNTK